jgi:hypothetical protein
MRLAISPAHSYVCHQHSALRNTFLLPFLTVHYAMPYNITSLPVVFFAPAISSRFATAFSSIVLRGNRVSSPLSVDLNAALAVLYFHGFFS